MAVEGTLDLFQLPEILQVVSQQRKTGILTVQGPADIVAVSFLDGRIVAADSLTETTEEGVGEVLVASGTVASDVLRSLSGRAAQGGPRLADLLVAEGHVDREHLLEALRTHTVQLLEALLDWRSGQFKFYGGDEVSYEEGFRSIGVDELLLRAIEDQERDRLPDPDSHMDRTTSDREVRVRTIDELGEVQPPVGELTSVDDALWLTPEEARVLDEVTSTRPVYEVAQAARVPLDRARYILFRLTREGLVMKVEAPPSAEPPAQTKAPAVEPVPLAVDAPIELALVPDEAPAAEPAPPARPPAKPPARDTVAPARAEAPPRRAERQAKPQRAREATSAQPERRLPITGLLSLILAAVMVGVLVFAPTAVTLPFPWLGQERAAQASAYDALLLSKIDQATKTYFLIKGRFPDRLQDLEALGLLRREDLVDARGQTLSYSAGEGSFQLRPVTPPGAQEAPSVRGSITGNFLLDPEFLKPARDQAEEPPLVLLD